MSENPKRVGPYTLGERISTGGQAHVFAAHGPEGHVALKIARTQASRPALLREASALERVEHPGIVRLVRADPDGSWLALERIDGESFARWIKDQSVADICASCACIADALAHLHAAGVAHGDLKPSNVIVRADGRPVVIDLGTALLRDQEVKGFRGTLGYAAPEVLRGARPSAASDAYALGVLLYLGLTSEMPFQAPDPAALGYLPLVTAPLPPAAAAPWVPALLSQLTLALLSRDPARRPADLARLARLLPTLADRPAGAPVVGMHALRDALYRSVVGASDGECRVVVVYGPPGSGRTTAIQDAVDAARREGLNYLQIKPADALAAMAAASGPSVVVVRHGQRGARELALAMLERSVPGLLLIHARLPDTELGALGAANLTPTPLSAAMVQKIAVATVPPRYLAGFDAALVARETMGLPVAVHARVRAWVRERSGQRLTTVDHLPLGSRKVLAALKGDDSVAVPELASRCQMGEHELLDHCEVLFAEGLVVPAWDGAAIKLAME
jgi:predicted Ser/Thr protein kinase